MRKTYRIGANSYQWNYFCVTPLNNNTTISWQLSGRGASLAPNLTMEYSTDRLTWHNYTAGTDITTSVPVYFKGNNSSLANLVQTDARTWWYYKLVSDNYIDLSGQLRSLVKPTYTENELSCNITSAGLGWPGNISIFSDNTYIHSVKDLIIDLTIGTIYKDGRYKGSYTLAGLFRGCSALIDTPIFANNVSAIPAPGTLDYLYAEMFKDCTSLVNVYTLPILNTYTGRYTFQSMFEECTSLAIPPKLPATTLSEGCYRQMFRGCISLTELPQLPATILPDNCYKYMFWINDYMNVSNPTGNTYIILSTQQRLGAGIHNTPYEFKIPYNATGSTTGTDSTLGMFERDTAFTETAVQTPALNTIYYCSLPTASD